jgi:heat shock protein HslJ
MRLVSRPGGVVPLRCRAAALACAIACAIILATATSAAALDSAAFAGTWRVLEIDGKLASHHETISFAADKISGRSACNHASATLAQAGDALRVSALKITAMGCGTDPSGDTRRRWAAERSYLDAFAAIRGHKQSGGDLLLTAADGRVLFRLTR